MSNSLWPHRLQSARLLCPWNSPRNNARVSCHFLLQEIFSIQGWNWKSIPRLLHLLHWQVASLPLASLALGKNSLIKKTGSVSHLIIYMFQCYSLRSSHPRLLPQSPKVCYTHLCLFFCPAYRVIVTIS